jgi:hypothetical protein
MKLKLDDDGHAVLKGELPVYEIDGKDVPFDAPAARAKIKEQAQDLDDLERSTTASGKELDKELKAWRRLGDIADVRKSVKTVAGLGEQDIDAAQMPAELETLRAERDALQDQLSESSETLKDRDTEIRTLSIGNQFANSPWIRENMIPAFSNNPSALEKIYGGNFKREKGKTVPVYNDGKPILTVDPETNQPRTATFDEAMAVLSEPSFRKPSGAKGSDTSSEDVAGGGNGQSRIKTKADFRNQAEKNEFIADKGMDAFTALPMK